MRLALAAAAVTTAGVERLHAPDTSGYLEPAAEMLSAGTFTRGGKPEIVRTPGYPLLLLPGLLVDRVEDVTVLLQALLLAKLAGRRDDPFQPLISIVIGAGLLLSTSALVRPVAYPVALVVGLSATWFALRRSAAPKSRWVPVALLTITAIAPLLGWQARNAVLADYGGLSAIVE